MVQCLCVGDGEHSCLHSRHGGMPFCGCDSPFVGLLNVSWPSPVDRATNFIPRLQQNKKPKTNPDLMNGALLTWEIGSKCFADKSKSVRGTQPFHKAWKKKEKEWVLIKYVFL